MKDDSGCRGVDGCTGETASETVGEPAAKDGTGRGGPAGGGTGRATQDPQFSALADALPAAGHDGATLRLTSLRACLDFLRREAEGSGMPLTATLIAAAADAALDETPPAGRAGMN
ncbi:MAG: hypothetical protein RID91_01815 [Azospirillaceae bacterium]